MLAAVVTSRAAGTFVSNTLNRKHGRTTTGAVIVKVHASGRRQKISSKCQCLTLAVQRAPDHVAGCLCITVLRRVQRELKHNKFQVLLWRKYLVVEVQTFATIGVDMRVHAAAKTQLALVRCLAEYAKILRIAHPSSQGFHETKHSTRAV